METEFKTLDDLHDALKAVADFCDDAVFARMFEANHAAESNLINQDNDRLLEVARQFEPGINEVPDFSEGLDALCRTSDDQAKVFRLVMDISDAYFAMGMLVGARLSDPSGQCFEKFSDGWIRSVCARPRYWKLKGTRRRRHNQRHDTEL